MWQVKDAMDHQYQVVPPYHHQGLAPAQTFQPSLQRDHLEMFFLRPSSRASHAGSAQYLPTWRLCSLVVVGRFVDRWQFQQGARSLSFPWAHTTRSSSKAQGVDHWDEVLGISCILIMKLKCNEMHEPVTLCCPLPLFLLCWHVVVSVLVVHSARAQVPGGFFAVIRFAGSPDRPRRAGNPSTTVLGPAMPWNHFDLFFVNVLYLFSFFSPIMSLFFCLGPSQLRFLDSSMSSWIKHTLGFSTW